MSATGEAGVTLVEMLAAMAVTALVSLVLFPGLQHSLAILGQRQTLAAVAARLRQARSDALRSDGPVSFSVSRDGLRFGEDPGPYGGAPPGVRVALTSATPGPIVFAGDGGSPGGRVVVSAGHASAAVLVEPISGVVAFDTAP